MVKNYKKCMALLLVLTMLVGCASTSEAPVTDPTVGTVSDSSETTTTTAPSTTVTTPTEPPAEEEETPAPFDNPSLSEAELADITASRRQTTPRSMPALTIGGTPSVYDELSGSYFFSVNETNDWEDLTPSVDGYTAAYTQPLVHGDKKEVVSDNEPQTVMVYNDTEYMELSVLFTSLPVISMNTKQLPSEWRYHDADEPYTVRYDSEGEPIPFDPYAAPSTDPEKPIGDYDTLVDLMLLDADAASHGYENGFTSLARSHIRGRSSRNYPKNSFKFELLKEGDDGVLEERDETLLGMRNDGDWNLNGMYAEPTKVRDKVAADLWLAITADREYEGVSTGYRTEYVEVIINGRYHGLYLMTERIDAKQMGLQDGDRMYFSEGDVTTGRFTDFLQLTDNEDMTVGQCSLEYPKERSEPYDEWVPFGELKVLYQATGIAAFKQKAADTINVDSLIDYEIFMQVASAVDNRIQNTFYIARLQEDGTYDFYFVPWDMDQTFGNCWGGEMPLLTEERFWQVETEELTFWVSTRFKSENAFDYNNRLKDRYAQLCDDEVIDDMTIIKMINSANKEMTESGAWERNEERWPEGGYSRNLAPIRAFVGNHMEFLDDLYDY